MSLRSTDSTLTPADLADWSEPGTHLAVIGDPVRHSLSPPMHNAALAQMAKVDARFASWRYWKIEASAEALPETLSVLHRLGFVGVNLTMPHKQIAVSLVTAIDPHAAAMGAVNTLRRTPSGYEGFNSDGYGIIEALRESIGVQVAGADIVLLGAGGAARAAAVAFVERGCRSLSIGYRSPGPFDALGGILRPIAGASIVRGFTLAEPPLDLPANAVIVNATPLGLKPGDPPPVDLARFPGKPAVYDMNYSHANTALTLEATRLGLRAASGLSMLVHQGVRSLEIWSGAKVPVDVMSAAASAALASR
ncbi:MAG TPA: shikimate dehydrogenase [Opitutaceae bacterium]|nr:shikimate dehydrogenase [Opitutaceae bacterium]